MELHGKVCLVTGGTKGIGAAAAAELACRGAHIAIVGPGLDGEALKTQAEIEALGRKCLLHIADVSRPSEAARCVKATAHGLGGMDVLIHSADGHASGGLLEVTLEAWHELFNMYVHSTFHLCRAAVPWMRLKREGAIVLISSAVGLRDSSGAIANNVVKGTVPQFARSLAFELAADNIRVNCISLGIIQTHFQNHLPPDQVANSIDNFVRLHREGRAEDVAEAIATLVCNNFITGENLTVGGGMTMRVA